MLFIFVQMYIWGQPKLPNMNGSITSFLYHPESSMFDSMFCTRYFWRVFVGHVQLALWFAQYFKLTELHSLHARSFTFDNFGNWISRNQQAHCSTLCFAHRIFAGHLLGMFDWHFDLFSILISRNWRSRQVRSFTFDITLSTQNRVAHNVWKFAPIGARWIIFIFRGTFFWLLSLAVW